VTLFASPFHARSAEANRGNCWATRNGLTLAERYDSVEQEALAARLAVAIADISWRWRVMLEGANTEAFLARVVTRNPAALVPGQSFKALWLADAGGVRGAGVIARYGRESFLLAASAPDTRWISSAASAWDVAVRDVSSGEGGIAVIGPQARATLEAAGFDAELEPLAFRKLSWRGVHVTLSRWGEHGGYEIWCAPDDGVLVWDRLMRAGAPFAIAPAGLAAMDVLDLEAGVARPELDYRPAREGDAAEPLPASLGLTKLIDETHLGFNGRSAIAGRAAARKLVGLEFVSDEPAPFTPVALGDRAVGHTLRSVHSPSLRRAIALAQIDAAAAVPGTAVSLFLPPSMDRPALQSVSATVVDLPFLPAPASITA
jgi:aminomethyltransferase